MSAKTMTSQRPMPAAGTDLQRVAVETVILDCHGRPTHTQVVSLRKLLRQIRQLSGRQMHLPARTGARHLDRATPNAISGTRT